MEGAALIQRERLRQVISEGWSADHDDAHANGELRHAAICYAHNAGRTDGRMPGHWPWDEDWWKPTGNVIRDLVKAGALIAAEIDRLQRGIDINAEDERAELLAKVDWRIGIAVTPKMRTHNHYRRLAVIRRIHRKTADTLEILDVELYDRSGETTRLSEPSSDWMTA